MMMLDSIFFTRIDANESFFVLPRRMVRVQGLEEDQQHRGEEGRQEGVQENVE